ncbi:septation protein SepH [Arthrobacter sp. LAPM80]|uniref:septation protein SepH n=1 Tax=Arthrobacter sp. LAPM80 TaxID=3141788 RepID=UPI00398B0298
MADLRLVGVHDDGRHLLLSGPDGDIYLLPLDEALRTAVGKSTHRSSRVPQAPGTRMSPREIQALIRAGASAADVSEQSGLSLDQVRRYEGPVLAERDYIASQARKVEVAAPSAHNDGYKSAFGESPATLEDMVRHRLGAFGINAKTLRWDAWRDHAGAWTVSADFDPGTEWAASSIGEPAPALWRFHSGRKALHNANRWAQQLSELDPLDSPLAERHLSAVIDKPFDVDADSPEAGLDGAVEADVAPEEEPAGQGGLLDMLRSRRGMRLGLDEDGDDELAAMLGTHVPGAHPRDEALYGTPEPAVDEQTAARDTVRAIPFLQLAPGLADDKNHLGSLDSVAEVSTETREIVLSGEPGSPLRPTHTFAEPVIEVASSHLSDLTAEDHGAAGDGPSDSEVAARLERKAAGKPKRSSVPSWDEIVFGTKGD